MNGEPLIERCPEPSPWWRNGLGWCLFVLAPGIGAAVTIAVVEVFR